jgi:hypothetical protein
LDKAILGLMPLADDMYALKFTKPYTPVSKEGQAMAINGIIKLLTLYSDNKTNDIIDAETTNIINMANFKAILTAA